MQAVLADIAGRGTTLVFAHTTIYMTDAISLYRSFGFELCMPFREVPEAVRHTEVFLKCDLRHD